METAVRTVRWLLLGGWFGSWALFAFVIAPLAFRVLPGVEVAGTLVSPLLRTLHLYGLAAGLGLFAIAFSKSAPRSLLVLPLVLAGLCAVTEFGVTAAITDIRPSTFGAGTQEDAAGKFSQLHMLSRGLFATILIGSGVLIGLHAREDARGVGQQSA